MDANTKDNMQHSITTTVDQAPSDQSTTHQAEQLAAAPATLAQSAILTGNTTLNSVDVATPPSAIASLAEATPTDANFQSPATSFNKEEFQSLSDDTVITVQDTDTMANTTAQQIAADHSILAQSQTSRHIEAPTVNAEHSQDTQENISISDQHAESSGNTDQSSELEKPQAETSILPYVSTSLNVSTLSAAIVLIDQAKKQALEGKFNETISNPRFWAKDSRYKTLMDNLVIPVFDDRSLQQFFNHATDDLITAAAKKSSSSGLPVVMPTEEEIKVEVWRRCEAGMMEQEIKSLNQKRKAEAKTTGTKHVPVKSEDVKAIVDAELAKLRASENC
jgi:uncharacterized protein involved in copper resistance